MLIKELCTGTILSWKHLLVHNAPENTRMEVPVKCFYIEHARYKILFDAGQKPLTYVQNENDNYLVKVTLEYTAKELLKKSGIMPEEIDLIVLSHLHADHSAGVADFPEAKILLQQREFSTGKHLWQNNIQLIDGEYEILQDKRLIVLPTYGHTPGHQSLLVTMDDSSKLLLTGDAAYTHDAINYQWTSEEYRKNPEYFDTLCRLRTLQQNNVKLIFSHE